MLPMAELAKSLCNWTINTTYGTPGLTIRVIKSSGKRH